MFGLSRILTALPSDVFKSALGHDILSAADWLSGMAKHDPDESCKEAAAMCLQVISSRYVTVREESPK